MPTYLALIISIAAGALGNILIKLGTKNFPIAPGISDFISSPLFITGFLVMGLSFPFYSLVLQRMSLSVAFPLVTSTTFLVVVAISYFFLKEPLTAANIFGILLLIAGLFLVAQK